MLTCNQPNISHASALFLVERAMKCASNMHIAISACVVDVNGRVKAKITMDGTSLIADELVEKKARTALLGLPTAVFSEQMKALPEIAQSLLSLDQITLMGGGYPIFHRGKIIGGFAVGGATMEQDMICAEAVLKQIPEIKNIDEDIS